MADENVRIRDLMVEEGRWQCNPLAAYQEGIEGVVLPSKYPTLLPGCTAYISFTIACHRLGKKARFTAHVEEIIIIYHQGTRNILRPELKERLLLCTLFFRIRAFMLCTTDHLSNTLNECHHVVLIGWQS